MQENLKMKWQKDLETFYPIYNSFILEGFVDDDYPYVDENDNVQYCGIHEYFDKVYSNHKERDKRKRVIIYDPTESESKRFQICDDQFFEIAEKDESKPGEEPKKVTKYTSSKLSQHFWEILKNEELDKLLIDHKAAGTSLDFSRIHYAVTESGDRIKPFEKVGSFSEIIDVLMEDYNEPSGYLFVIKMTSRLLSRDGESNGISAEELMIFRQLLSIVHVLDKNNDGSEQRNKLVVLANKLEDLPKWFVDETANPSIKHINVSRPSEDNILDFFHEMMRTPGCFTKKFIDKYNEIDRATNPVGVSEKKRKRNPIEKKFLAYTNEFGMKMLRKYVEYLKNAPLDDPARLGYSVSNFRLGDMTNPWDQMQRIKDMLTIVDTVKIKLKGQDNALESAQNILTRAAIGLDRAENPNAPRVVLFLAGPTGTGKTELCKQLAECVFGSEERIVRFDMSEYGQEESDQKLFGAPPGYVGYEEGGKLTNAIKKEPFSLVLFDEIEKAHNSILDKFLQILGDGRLTDGKGDTVRFTDCIIVITSNAGVNPDKKSLVRNRDAKQLTIDDVSALEEQKIAEGKVDANGRLTKEARDEIYTVVRDHIAENVKEYFYNTLGRPELYGRVEDAMVYYNYIGRDCVGDIVRGKINEVIKSTKETTEIAEITCSDAVLDAIVRFCQRGEVRSLGARGIIKNTGKLFSGSLSNYIADHMLEKEGRRMEDLCGQSIVCSCPDTIKSADDIKWENCNG